MKNCPVCQHALNDDALDFTHCGFSFAPILGMSVDTANARLAEQRRAYQEKQATQSRAAAEPAHAGGVETAQNSAKTNRNGFILAIIIAMLGFGLYFAFSANDEGQADLAKKLQQLEQENAQLKAEQSTTTLPIIGNRYRDNQNGTVTDLHTGLQWKRCSEGQTWNGSTCTGEAKKYTWNEAMSLRSEFAGHSDWRLPTITELNTLVYCSNGKQRKFKEGDFHEIEHEGHYGCTSNTRGDYRIPTIDTQAFPYTPVGWSWSGSPYAAYPDYAWYVFFFYGNGYGHFKNDGNPVRLVRGQ